MSVNAWCLPELPGEFLDERQLVYLPLEELLEGYRRYLVVERGVMQQTVARYEPDARLFLSWQQERDGVGVEAVDVGRVQEELRRQGVRLG